MAKGKPQGEVTKRDHKGRSQKNHKEIAKNTNFCSSKSFLLLHRSSTRRLSRIEKIEVSSEERKKFRCTWMRMSVCIPSQKKSRLPMRMATILMLCSTNFR